MDLSILKKSTASRKKAEGRRENSCFLA